MGATQPGQYPDGGIHFEWGSCKQGDTQEATLDVEHLAARSQIHSLSVLSLPPPAPSHVPKLHSPGTTSKGIL